MNYKFKENIKVLVIGDLMLDHYIYGDCNRISPEAPVQVVEVKSEQYTLGGAGNVLKNLISFNAQTDIMSVTGDDDNAVLIHTYLSEAGVALNGIIKDKNRCTTTKSRVLVSNHQLIRLDKEDTKEVDATTTQRLLKILESNIKNYDIVLISDYNKGLLSKALLEKIFELCRAAGKKTLVDPKGDDFSKYKGANIIKPNKKEASLAAKIRIEDRKTLEAACQTIKEITGCDDVIVTMSEEGIGFYSGGEISVIPTKALDVIDVTGAGDTVLAALGVAIASGSTLYEACDFANHAAAIVVTKVGSATVTLSELANFH